jgi:hypothetical protein
MTAQWNLAQVGTMNLFVVFGCEDGGVPDCDTFNALSD